MEQLPDDASGLALMAGTSMVPLNPQLAAALASGAPLLIGTQHAMTTDLAPQQQLQQQAQAQEQQRQQSQEHAEELEEQEEEPVPAWLQPRLRVEVEGDPREGFPETYCAAVVSRPQVVGGRVLVEYEEVRVGSFTEAAMGHVLAHARGCVGGLEETGLNRAAGTGHALDVLWCNLQEGKEQELLLVTLV